jgi:hypothetical protein
LASPHKRRRAVALAAFWAEEHPTNLANWHFNGAQRRKRDRAPRLMARIALADASA